MLMGNVADEACPVGPMMVTVAAGIQNCNWEMRRGDGLILEVIAVGGQGEGVTESGIWNEDHPRLEVLRVLQTCAASAVWGDWHSVARQTLCPVCAMWERLGDEGVVVVRR